MIVLLLESKTIDRQSKDWKSFAKKLTENAIKKCGWKINQIEDIDSESDPLRRIFVKVDSRSLIIRTSDIYDSKTKKSVCCYYGVYEIDETEK
jgi:hypothetical protein